MKLTKLLALVLALIMAVGVLASCGNKNDKPATFGSFLNTSYNTYADVVSSLSLVSELEGFSVQTSNDEFVILSKIDDDDSDDVALIYKVVALRTGNVIATFSNTAKTETSGTTVTATSTTYDFGMLDADLPAFSVMKQDTTTVTTPTEYETDTVTTYTIYDATGATVVSQNSNFTGEINTFNDWLILEDAVYTVNKDTGALTKKCDTPANFKDMWNFETTDTYIYAKSSSNIIVYDYDFKVVAIWSTPANAETVAWFVLNNGDVFIQYVTVLDPNTKEYDLFDGTTLETMEKYNLSTVIYSVAEKTSSEIEFDYFVADGSSRYALNNMADGEEVYAADAFENVVEVYPIVDKRLDDSEARKDFLVIDNKGKIVSSLKLVEYQTDLPAKISADKYLVSTLYGTAIVDATGTVLTQYNNANFEQVGDYFVDINNEYGIYDMSFNVVYDFSEKNAEFIEIVNDTIFVVEYTDAKQEDGTVIGFAKGNQFTVFTYDADGENNLDWSVISDAGIYSLYDSKTKEYTYYNMDGTKLLTDAAEASYFAYSKGTVSLIQGTKTIDGNTTTVYFIAK